MSSGAARGNLDFDLPEAEIILDLQGLPENIVRAERNVAHRIIEEFMIAANEAVARHLTEKDFPTLYRVHEGPDQQALEALAPFLLSLGYRLPQKKETIAPLEIQKLIGIRARQTGRTGDQSRALAVDETGDLPAGEHRPLRPGIDLLHPFHVADTALSRSDRAPHVGPSNARRKAQTQRERRSAPLPPRIRQTYFRARAPRDGRRTRNDRSQESPVHDEQIGRRVSPASSTRLANFGFFVELDNFFIEGLVRLSSLADDDYDYYEKEYVIKGRRHGRKFRLGDNVRVKAVRINAFRSEIDFELVQSGEKGRSKSLLSI